MPLFTELITGFVDDAAYAEFQKELLRNPKKGNVIPHSGGLRKIRMRLPRRVKPIKAKEIVAIREKMAVSQAVFARLLNVPKVTEISWEKGRRKPTGAALRLLDLVRKTPNILQEA